MIFNLFEQRLLLLPEKVIYWEDQQTMIIADLHLGKINHFRRSGIPVPTQPNDINIEKLISLLQTYKPDRVIFLGDLFHSHYNPEWEVFGQVLKNFPGILFELIVGNHDIMSDYQYQKHKLILHGESLELENFIFTHEPMENIPDGKYNLSGHLHPGVILRGKGRQGLRLPCFYFSDNYGFLPAFGEFTGYIKMRPKKTDNIFILVEGEVIQV